MAKQVNFAFVHGGGQGGWVWAETIAALNVQTNGTFGRAIALDVPGCGTKRGRPTNDLSMQDVARELTRDIEEAGLDDVLLVGHSQGGQVLSMMLQLRPELFRRVVHVSCSIPMPGQTVQDLMGVGRHGADEAQVGWPFEAEPENFAQSIVANFPLIFCNDMDQAETAAFMGKLGKDQWPMSTYAYSDWRHDQHAFVPATYVVCLRDACLTIPWQEKFADRFKAERRVRIDAGHQAMNTRPHALAEILLIEAECDISVISRS